MPYHLEPKHLRVALAVAIATSAVKPACAAPPMLPGAWEQASLIELIDNETRIARKLSESKTTACFTASTLAKPPLNSEKITRLGGKCELPKKDANSVGASETWRISCESADGKKYRLVSQLTYTQTTMRSVLLSTTEYRGEIAEGRVTTEGKRIGECTPEMVAF
ncbi:DUF3617 domain-containing protein [Rhizobacter sp. P5_C2]